jgi:hypothetical protein
LDIFFGAVLLVLAGAIVLLFAMLGELASRLPSSQRPARSKDVVPVEDAQLDSGPEYWPAPFTGLVDRADPAYLFVLSTACTSCQDVAQQLSAELDLGEAGDIGVVISSASPVRGEEFASDYGLQRLPYYVDENGDWASTQFNIRMSPTALVVDRGRAVSAVVFHEIDALRKAAPSMKGVA